MISKFFYRVQPESRTVEVLCYCDARLGSDPLLWSIGSNVIIQTSTDLQIWTPIQTNILNTNGLLYFSDSQSSPASQRFYQAVVP
jgi:hypothetical protein